ncbi:DUF1931 family protein (plasmid) [Rhodococcus sp. USK10]|uniref:DUF1931 family protein n=1 Tax=Rhodococcus sp. USK10 TaxID=2789739 RepID=UPI001C5E9E13|nr:DUF1931 family protein [Rhodococcus sp. USK10]QYB00630.1 DUF1931 family protein [Rhodococcus sp. USK10]
MWTPADLVGGLAVTPARTFTVTAPGLTRPGPAHWETVRATCICDPPGPHPVTGAFGRRRRNIFGTVGVNSGCG